MWSYQPYYQNSRRHKILLWIVSPKHLSITCGATGIPIPELTLYRIYQGNDLPQDGLETTKIESSNSVLLTYNEMSPTRR